MTKPRKKKKVNILLNCTISFLMKPIKNYYFHLNETRQAFIWSQNNKIIIIHSVLNNTYYLGNWGTESEKYTCTHNAICNNHFKCYLLNYYYYFAKTGCLLLCAWHTYRIQPIIISLFFKSTIQLISFPRKRWKSHDC